MNPWEWLLSASMHRFVFLSAVAGVGISVIALFGGRLLRRQSASARYGILFVGVSGMLASPLLVAIGPAIGAWTATPVTETVRIPGERLVDAMTSKAPESAIPNNAEPGVLAWIGATLGSVWFVGIGVGLVALVRGHWMLRKTLVGELWQPAWCTEERRAKLATMIGLARFPTVRQSPFAPFPIVVGLRRPTIVFPTAKSEPWTSSQWEAVLLHEAAHVARRDPLAALVQSTAVTLYWWWPVAHILSRRLHDLRETICDDFALKGACDPAAYAELLMQSAERLVNLRTSPSVVGLLDSTHGGLNDRITRLLTKEKRTMTRLSLVGKLLGPAAMLLACLTVTAASAFSQAPSPPKNIQIKIVIDGKEFDLNDEAVQALLARQKSQNTTATQARWVVSAEGVVVDDPRIDQLVRQAEVIKPGAGEAVRKLLAQKLSFDRYVGKVPTRPTEIEDLVKRAEALAPGSGEKIRTLLVGERHVIAAPGMPVPVGVPVIPPHAEAAYRDTLRLYVLSSDGKQLVVGMEPPKLPEAKMIYRLEQAVPFAAPTGSGKAATPSPTAPAGPTASNEFRPLAAELAQKNAELDALARQVERINAEVRAIRQHIDQANDVAPRQK